jgi:hypothetical protein
MQRATYSLYLTCTGVGDRALNVPVTVFHERGVYRTGWDQNYYANDWFFVRLPCVA